MSPFYRVTFEASVFVTGQLRADDHNDAYRQACHCEPPPDFLTYIEEHGLTGLDWDPITTVEVDRDGNEIGFNEVDHT